MVCHSTVWCGIVWCQRAARCRPSQGRESRAVRAGRRSAMDTLLLAIGNIHLGNIEDYKGIKEAKYDYVICHI
jgi:hypothetical protein